MTRLGGLLNSASQLALRAGVSYQAVRPVWAWASTSFASGTQGPVMFFEGLQSSPAGVWAEYELPMLQGNGIQIVTGGH
jgi:hypothetical protein